MMRTATVMATLVLTGHLAAAETNHCEIAITGASSSSIKADAPTDKAQGKLALVTDHWLSDAELRIGIGAFVGLGGKLSKEEKERKIDEAMKQDPRFMLFILNCLTDEGGAIFSASGKSKYADFPRKPGTHAIVASGTAKPGEVTVMFHLSPGGKRESYSVKAPGKLVLTQFDKKGVAGTFSFQAEARSKDKQVDVSGKFNYACTGGACQK